MYIPKPNSLPNMQNNLVSPVPDMPLMLHVYAVKSVGIIKERRYAKCKAMLIVGCDKGESWFSSPVVHLLLPSHLSFSSSEYLSSLVLRDILEEHRQRTTRHRQTHSIPSRSASLKPRLPRRRLRRGVRLLRRIHKCIARQRTRFAVRARRRNKLHTADLSATGGIRRQERASTLIRLGAHFASCRCELRCRCDDGGAALGISGGLDDGRAVLGRCDGLAGGVCGGEGYGDGGGDLA